MSYAATVWAIRFVWLFILIPVVIGICIWRHPIEKAVETDELRRD